MVLLLHRSDRIFETQFAAFLASKREISQSVDATVAAIIHRVRAEGDKALTACSREFDGVDLSIQGIRVGTQEIAAAVRSVTPETMAALRLAHERITAYHEKQTPQDIHFTDALGVELGWRWTAVESIGLYVPGGTASYPSSVLMNAVPAKVARVERLVMVVPTPGGRINPLVLAAADLAGVDEIYRVGGAQAIAALAYGTQTILATGQIVCVP